MSVKILKGDCLEILPTLAADSIDAIVTDPPYGLGFMGKDWDSPGGLGDFPMRRVHSTNMVNTGVTRQGGRQRSCEDFTKRQIRDARAFGEWCEAWAVELLRVLKPGAHLICFGGTRTYHRMACAIEDAGFEIRDQIQWLYGSGFPKSHDVSKALDRANGIKREDKFEASFERRVGPTGNKRCEKCGKWLVSGSPCQCPRPQDRAVSDIAREWEGWGTALKPAHEPIVLARKSLIGNVAENVAKFGTGAMNIDACRVEGPMDGVWGTSNKTTNPDRMFNGSPSRADYRTAPHEKGRWPANIIHDGSDEVLAAFPETTSGTGAVKKATGAGYQANAYGKESRKSGTPNVEYGGSGSAGRFFYTPKADDDDRLGSKHPTVKPVDLIAYLCRLITPPKGIVLDPFAGSGSTGMACLREGFDCVLIEREAEYVADIERRIKHVAGEDTPLFQCP